MRLPKAEVARLMKESRDPAEAAERIMQLCVARDQGGPAPARPAAPVSALCSNKPAMKKEVSMFPIPPGRDLSCVDRVRHVTLHFPISKLVEMTPLPTLELD
jgi:hypothetical protein